jgi:hypothetical protein
VKANNGDDRDTGQGVRITDACDAEYKDDGSTGDLQESNAENTSKSPLLSSGKLQRCDVRKR